MMSTPKSRQSLVSEENDTLVAVEGGGEEIFFCFFCFK